MPVRRPSTFLSAVACSLLLLALPRNSSALVATVEPVRDNTLFEDADGDTSNGAGPAFFAGKNNQNLTRRAVVNFGVEAVIPAGAVIDSAALTLVVSSAPDLTTRQFRLHRVLADWGEGQSSSSGGAGAPATAGDATWLHTFYPGQFWAHAGGDFDTTTSAIQLVTGVGVYTWTGPGMKADVLYWLGHPGTNFGWLVQGEESAPRTVRLFDSRESDVADNHPKLTIYYSITTAIRSTTWGYIKSHYK
jgi:hypothetical protein